MNASLVSITNEHNPEIEDHLKPIWFANLEIIFNSQNKIAEDVTYNVVFGCQF